MTLPIVDDTTALSSANLHKFVYGDGDSEFAILCYRIIYDGAEWDISTTRGGGVSALNVTAVWNGTNKAVTIDWSGVTPGGATFGPNWPIVQVTPELDSGDYTTARYWTQAKVITADTCDVTFWDQAQPDTQETTETLSMAFMITIFGRIE